MKQFLLSLYLLIALQFSNYAQQGQTMMFASATSGTYQSGVVNYASSTYMFKFKEKDLKVFIEDDVVQYITLSGYRWYPYDIDDCAFFVKQEGSQKLTYIDGKIYQWIGNPSEDNVELTMMYQIKGYPNKDLKKYLKTLNGYLSKNVPNTDDAKAKAAAIITKKAKSEMESGDLTSASNYISDARMLYGYRNQEANNLGDKIIRLIENEKVDKINQMLKDGHFSIYGKDVEDIDIKITKYDYKDYPSGYFSYYNKFEIVVEATLSDGSIISTDNTETFLDPKKNTYLSYLHADYDVNVYGCKSMSSSTYMPYPWKDDMYAPFVTVEVTSNYDSKLTKAVQIPVSYSKPVIVDYRGQSSIKPGSYAASPEYIGGDGADITVEVWTGKNEYNGDLIILYDVYETDGELLNTVYLEPNVDLLVYTSGSKSPRGNDGELTVVVKDDDANGYYSVKSDVSTPFKGNSNETDIESSSDSSDEITVTNKTGQSVCIAHYGGATNVGNGNSITLSCRDIYYGVMDGAHCTGKFGAKIADEDNDCGRTITLE